MKSLLDNLEASRVDLTKLVQGKRTGKFQINPEHFPDNWTERLIIMSGVNRTLDDDYMLEQAHLAEDMLLSIPCITDLSDIILTDVGHCPNDFKVIKDTRMFFSFRPDVYTYYKTVKLLNNIRHIFFGTIGGCGFTSPVVYIMREDRCFEYIVRLDFGFFQGIRRDRMDEDDYKRILPIFKICSLEPDVSTLPRILKECVERMDNRDVRYYKRN